MAKIHYFQRYSSAENTVTNNTLHLIARIYEYSPERMSSFLEDILEQQVEVGITFIQQTKAKASIPDGELRQPSFRLLIETKVDAVISADQLLRHASDFRDEQQKILLLLTKQRLPDEKISDIQRAISLQNQGVIFKNVTFDKICSAADGLFQDYESDMKAVVNDYSAYCNDTGLSDQSKFLMRIVPCGTSLKINQRYGIYFQPSWRGYRNHSFVGMYDNKRVKTVLAIESVFDVALDGESIRKTLVQGRQTDEFDERIKGIIRDAPSECGYDLRADHRFFCGRTADTNYVKASRGGIMGPKFVDLRDVADVAAGVARVGEELRSKTWS